MSYAMPIRYPAMLARLIFVTCLSSLHAAEPIAAVTEDGFRSIFDGTLENWDGDPVYWKARDGILVGEVTPGTLLKRNSFIIWRGGELADFELKLEYRVSAMGNSGVNYRSAELPDMKWAMRGYQADIDGRNEYTGQNYEERGRQFLSYRGQSVRLAAGKAPELVRELGDRASLAEHIPAGEWNRLHIIARGNRIQHFINGHLMSEVLDEDAGERRLSGLLGVQVHVGPPMKIEFRNILLKQPDRQPAPAE